MKAIKLSVIVAVVCAFLACTTKKEPPRSTGLKWKQLYFCKLFMAQLDGIAPHEAGESTLPVYARSRLARDMIFCVPDDVPGSTGIDLEFTATPARFEATIARWIKFLRAAGYHLTYDLWLEHSKKRKRERERERERAQ